MSSENRAANALGRTYPGGLPLFVTHMNEKAAALGMREHTETYDRIGDVPAWVHDLEHRWQEEEARGRVFVSPEESILIVSVPTEVPPQVAWDQVAGKQCRSESLGLPRTDSRWDRHGRGRSATCS